MPELLIEIYGEEIPPSTQVYLEKKLEEDFNLNFKKNDILYSKINIFSTSRRLVVCIDGIPSKKKEEVKLIRGPLVSSNEQSIKGFLKSNNLKNRKTLFTEKINNKEYFFYKKKIPSMKNSEVLSSLIPNLLRDLKWKKSMRWANNSDRWIRPIKSILCLFDSKVLKFEFAGLVSSNKTYGNYVFSKKQTKCLSFKNLRVFLKNNNVILDGTERERVILNKLNIICKKQKLSLNEDSKLLNEVSRFVEFPNVFFGSFDKSFFSMPEIFLTSVISGQQKYFSFRDFNGKLSNIFAFVTNHSQDKNNLIKKGNERVLRARFKDAQFFIKEDTSLSLYKRLEKLKYVKYYEGLGNLFEKSQRILSISEWIAKKLEFDLSETNKKIILLSKVDLISEMVKEFPSLQGKVGSYYANLEGFNEQEYNSLVEQYSPNSPKDKVPKSKISICLAIAEKIDNIVGTFLSGKKPSGSGDPYSLRRSALGILRILIENKIDISINEMIFRSYKLFKYKDVEKKFNLTEIMNFFSTRLFVHFKNESFQEGVIKSLVKNELNPYLIFFRAKILLKFIKAKKGYEFLSSFKRIDSILPLDENKEDILVPSLFKYKEEKDLYSAILDISKNLNSSNDNVSFSSNLKSTEILSPIINSFFENVKVNIDDEKQKKNRLCLLYFCKKTLNKICSFSLIE